MSNATEKAYQRIRDAIIAGTFPAGAHLAEQKLAQITGVSRTPVREALRRLNAEHFVHFQPNRGAYVADWSPNTVEEIFALRALLEGYAAARAASRVSESELVELEGCVDEIDSRISGRKIDYDAIMVANRRFHALLVTAAHSERLEYLLQALVETPMILRTLTRYSSDELRRSNLHHREIIAACRARDEEWARSVMTAHLHAAQRIFARQQGRVAPGDGD